MKDRRILFELEQDSRQSLNQIAKKVGLRKETVFYRIKNLEKSGIIKKYLTEINTYKLGYQYNPVLIKYENTTPIIEDEIYCFLKEDKNVAWLARCEGGWDINFTLIVKNNHELNWFLNRFLLKYSNYIAEKEVFITTEISYFKKGFGISKARTNVMKPSSKRVSIKIEKTTEIEDIDLRLLTILANDARKPLIVIGEELGTHPKNISYRIKKLEQKKIIQGSRIVVDFSKMGYKLYKVWFSLKNMSTSNINRMMNYFEYNRNITWASKTIGCYDLSIEMEVESVEAFRKILGEIKNRFSDYIKKHESLLIFEEGVMNYLPV